MTVIPARTLAELTAPGGLFPLARSAVDGAEYFDREPRTLRDAFLATREYGSMDALVSGDQRWTFDRQWRIVVGLANRLHDDLGIGKGDRIAIAMRNLPEWVFAFWAGQVLGAITIPVNAWLGPTELQALLADSRPSVLFADGERLDRLAATPPALQVIAVGAHRHGALDYADLAVESDGEPPEADVESHDVATVLYTSGTTGRPKGTVGTHANHSAAVLNKLIRGYFREVEVPDGTDPNALTLPPPSNKLVTFPFFHIAGLNTLYSATYSAHKMVLMHKWDANEALRLIEAERINEMSGAPHVIRGLLDEAARSQRDLTSLVSVGLGGSAAPAQLILDVREAFGGRVSARTGYGLTETTSGVVAIAGADYVKRPSSVGTPLPTVEIAILDESGAPVNAGTVGEVAISGPQVVAGYENRPEETAAAFVEGWFHTGDLGRVDADGFLYIVGRIKEIIIRGGENVSPGEVENALADHPDVLEVAVVGVPHPTLGEEVAAVIRLREGARTSVQDLRAFAHARLAAFKVPAHVRLHADPLPRSGTGKILKPQLRDTLLENATR